MSHKKTFISSSGGAQSGFIGASSAGSAERAAGGVLAYLPPAQVPRAQANGGIGWGDVADPQKAVIVLVGPYDEILVGDQINLYWGDPDRAVDHLTVEVAEVGLIPMRVMPADIQLAGEGTLEVFYTVTSSLTGDTDRSQPTPVVVKLNLPGGPDPEPGTPYVNENLAAPQVPFDLIGEEEAEAGFDVTILPWLNMAADDKLTLSWGGVSVPGPSPLVVGQPVLVAIDKATVIAGGDADGLVVRYQVRDRVNNWSLWSPSALVDVEAGGSSLQAPIVVEAPAGTLDLDALAGRDVTVLVLRYDVMALGDKVTLTWDGRTAEGGPVVEVQTQEVRQLGPFLTFTIPNAVATAIAQGHAMVRYQVAPVTGGAPLPSKRTPVAVVGTVQELDPPVVLEAVGGVLDPADTTQGATVRIEPYAVMAPGDEVFLWWEGTTAGGVATLYRDSRPITGGNTGQPVLFPVPSEEVSQLAGGRVELYYEVQTAARALLESPHEVLQVAGAAALPPPAVDHTVGNVLDPDAVPAGGTTVRVPADIGLVQGDVVTMYWDGRDAASSTSDFFPIGPSWGNKEVPFPLAKSYVSANLGFTVQVRYTVTPAAGGTPRPSQRRPLEIRQDTHFAEPVIEEAIGDTLDIRLFEGDAHIKTEPHDHLRAGMYYWASVVSVTDIEIPYPVANRAQLTAAEARDGLRIPIARSILETLPDDSTLKVVVRANIKGTDDPFDVVDFPVKTYDIGSGWTTTWDLDDLDPAQVTPIKMGGTLSFPLMNIIFTAAVVDPENNTIGVEEFNHELPDYYSGVVLYIGSPEWTAKDNTVTITFKRNWSRVRFAMTSVDNDVTVDWLDASSSVIDSETVVGGDVAKGHDVEHASDTANIRGVRIKAIDVIRLDYFKFLA